MEATPSPLDGGLPPVPPSQPTRRQLLANVALAATAAACATTRPGQGPPPVLTRRCEQLHERVRMPVAQMWQRPLPLPVPAELGRLHSGSMPDGGRIGAVAQWVAPEWFWVYPEWGTRSHHGTIGDGELPSPAPDRHRTVYPGKRVYRDGEPRPDPSDELTAEQHPHCFHMEARDFVAEIVPGYRTRMLGYAPKGGAPASPGPLFEVDLGQHLMVRVDNAIDRRLHLEVSVHLHGGHTPAHADGHPNFMIKPGEARDYFYPNPVPLHVDGELRTFEQDGMSRSTVVWTPRGGDWDLSEVPSTMWYHDHAEDITAHNALMGLAGIYLLRDATERQWIEDEVLPRSDIPIALRDVCLCPVDDVHMAPEVRAAIAAEPPVQGRTLREARIHFDPFDHDGALGDLVLCNGAPFPHLVLAPGKHRLRLLNASLARFYHLRFVAVRSDGPDRGLIACDDRGRPQFLEVLRIGKDSWLLERPIRTASTFLGMATRADVVFDVDQPVTHRGEAWPLGSYDVYLVSTLVQRDGRGPGHGDNEFEAEAPRGGIEAVPVEEGNASDGKQWFLPGDPQLVDGKPPPITGRDDAQSPPWLWLLQLRVDRSLPVSEATVVTDTTLRKHEPILPTLRRIAGAEGKIPWHAIPRRVFDFERRQGAWQINHRFYDASIANAAPSLWSTEVWVLRNKSGGWWHPIHIHLESHQQVYVVARDVRGDKVHLHVPGYDPGTGDEVGSRAPHAGSCEGGAALDPTVWNTAIKHDTTVLGPNTEVHVLMRFRTFQGPFVFHCHNLNHEDMRMMFQFDPRWSPPDQHADRDRAEVPVRPQFWCYTEPPHGGA